LSKKKRGDEAPLPATSAGLIRFFEDESVGVKVSPYVVVAIAVLVVIIVALALYLSGGGSWLSRAFSSYAGGV